LNNSQDNIAELNKSRSNVVNDLLQSKEEMKEMKQLENLNKQDDDRYKKLLEKDPQNKYKNASAAITNIDSQIANISDKCGKLNQFKENIQSVQKIAENAEKYAGDWGIEDSYKIMKDGLNYSESRKLEANELLEKFADLKTAEQFESFVHVERMAEKKFSDKK
jgi:hypothetical protein